MIRSGFAAFLIVSATGAVAGMYDQPWSEIQVADPSQVRKEKPPAITRIDGKSTRNTFQSDPLPPGKHMVRIRYETGRVQQSEAEIQRELEMTLEPCTRYMIAAQRTEGTQWEPKIYQEPIGECARKFKR
jgi:hypothetical protein